MKDTFYDVLETREPAAREAALMGALPAQVRAAQGTAAFAELLANVDAAEITSRSALAQLPVTRKHELLARQQAARAAGGDPFGGFSAVGWRAQALAWLASRLRKVPLILIIYGIDAWQPTKNRLANWLADRADWVVSISDITAQKFRAWARAGTQQLMVLPNAIHPEWYGPGVKNPALLKRYRLEGKTVLMTLGRLVSAERYKGFDEVIDVLPALASVNPNLAYLIVGEGSDRRRLEEKVRALGLADRVVFAGLVPEVEKADHYRLADAYIMASRGEGFGFVLLEAMACGVPVIASTLDGGREAVLDGKLGMLVDPGDADGLKRAVLDTLQRPTGVVPEGLEHFAFPHFEARVHGLIGQVLPEPASPLSSP